MNPRTKIEMLSKMMLIRHLEDQWGQAYQSNEIDGLRRALRAGQGTGCHHAQSMYSWFVPSPGLRVVLPLSGCAILSGIS
jgi:TPP-dependent pyruvate/acetoin dehydrogenase alpha subunit